MFQMPDRRSNVTMSGLLKAKDDASFITPQHGGGGELEQH